MATEGLVVGNLTIPAVLLHGRTDESVQMTLRMGTETLELSVELQEICDRIAAIHADQGQIITDGRSFFWSNIEVKETDDHVSIDIGLGGCRYYPTLLTVGLDEQMRKIDSSIGNGIRELVDVEEILKPEKIGSHPLRGGAGLTSIVRTSDSYTILTRRSDSVVVQPSRIHTAIAEGFSWRDLSEAKSLDLRKAVERSLTEELLSEGTELEDKRVGVHVLGFCVDLRIMRPGILIEVITPFSKKEIEEGQFFAHDKWEREKIWSVPFDPRSCAKELRRIDEWTGFGALALTLSLIKEFGEKEVITAFSAV